MHTRRLQHSESDNLKYKKLVTSERHLTVTRDKPDPRQGPSLGRQAATRDWRPETSNYNATLGEPLKADAWPIRIAA